MMNNNIRVIGLKAGEGVFRIAFALANSITAYQDAYDITPKNNMLIFHDKPMPMESHILQQTNVRIHTLRESIDDTINYNPNTKEILFIYPERDPDCLANIEAAAKRHPNIIFYIITQLNNYGRYKDSIMTLINENLNNTNGPIVPIVPGDVVRIYDKHYENGVGIVIAIINNKSTIYDDIAEVLINDHVISVDVSCLDKITHSGIFDEMIESFENSGVL